jgi:hypothetical protein
MKTTIENFRIGRMGAAVTAEIVTPVPDKQPIRTTAILFIGTAREAFVTQNNWRDVYGNGVLDLAVFQHVNVLHAEIADTDLREITEKFFAELKKLGVIDLIERATDGQKADKSDTEAAQTPSVDPQS